MELSGIEYQSLNNALHQCRFLRFRCNSDREGILGFDIVVGSLNDPPKYSALSYCWGDLRGAEHVTVDDRSVRISQNLVHALRNSGARTDDLVWADAICIDQGNPDEKNHQVGLMGQIYAKAQRVAVWLGPATRETTYAAMFLRDFASHPQFRRLNSEPDETSLPIFFSSRRGELGADEDEINFRHFEDPDIADLWFSKKLRDQPHPSKALRGVHDILARSYWERVWIIQEVAKARWVVVRCGSLRLNLNAILAASSCLTDLPERTRTLLDSLCSFIVRERRSSLDRSYRVPLYQALIATRYSLATNPLDKIYSLLGLTSDGNDLLPIPSYTDEPSIVFQRVSRAIRRSSRHNNILLLAPWVPLSPNLSQRVDWGVDWMNVAFHIPPWLTSDLFAAAPHGSQVVQNGPRTFYVRARKIAVVQGYINETESATVTPTSIDSTASIADSYFDRMDEIEPGRIQGNPSQILHAFCDDILRRYEIGLDSGELADQRALVDAFSRLIRDAYQGKAVTRPQLGKLRHGLALLGNVRLGQNPVWAWAMMYNRHTKVPTHTAVGLHSILQMAQAVANLLSCGTSSHMSQKHSRHSALNTWRRVLAGIDCTSEFPLRYCVVRNDRLSIVARDTRPGDTIYQIDQCQLPVVLRKKENGNFAVVGEACLARHTNGKWIEALYLPEPFQLSDTPVETITVDPCGLSRHESFGGYWSP